MKRSLRVIGMMLCMAGASEAHGDEVTRATSLTCGGTRFTAITHRVHDYTTAQEMWVHPSGAKRMRPVDLRQSTFVLRRIVPGLAVVADEIGQWGCAKTRNGHVLMLWYDCPQLLPADLPARFCSETGEWYRYVAADGTLLDKGFGLGRGMGDTGPREKGLRARLGLPPDHEDVNWQGVLFPNVE